MWLHTTTKSEIKSLSILVKTSNNFTYEPKNANKNLGYGSVETERKLARTSKKKKKKKKTMIWDITAKFLINFHRLREISRYYKKYLREYFKKRKLRKDFGHFK